MSAVPRGRDSGTGNPNLFDADGNRRILLAASEIKDAFDQEGGLEEYSFSMSQRTQPPRRLLVGYRWFMLVALLTCGALIGVAALLSRASSQASAHTTWVQVGYPGQWIGALAAHPGDPALVYAYGIPPMSPLDYLTGNIGAALFRSEDGGSTWRTIGPRPDVDASPAGFIVDHNGVIYRVDLAGTHTSADGGATWTNRDRAWAEAVVLLPLDPPLLYAIGHRYGVGVFSRTTDGGETWEIVNPDEDVNCIVPAIASHPAQPEVVFLGCYRGTLRTEDGGYSWTTVLRGRTSAGGRGPDGPTPCLYGGRTSIPR
jgi:hypothetical protein